MTTRGMPPNLFVVGVQKCGTTLLCKYLAAHPQFLHSTPKEPFSLQRQMDPDGFQAYLDTKFTFSNERDAPQYKVDGSTTYFQSATAMRNIATYCGRDVRIIVSLRHPVHRAVSHFFHDIRKGRGAPQMSILDPYYVAKSTYAPHLERWREFARPGRLLVLRYDDLVADTGAFLGQAFDFLGLPPPPVGEAGRVNAGWSAFLEGDTIRVAETDTHRIPVEHLFSLHDRLMPDIERTGRITGWCVDDWTAPLSPSLWQRVG